MGGIGPEEANNPKHVSAKDKQAEQKEQVHNDRGREVIRLVKRIAQIGLWVARYGWLGGEPTATECQRKRRRAAATLAAGGLPAGSRPTRPARRPITRGIRSPARSAAACQSP